jgi:hypothetical protein
MRFRRIFLSVVTASALARLAAACVGDDPDTVATERDAGPADATPDTPLVVEEEDAGGTPKTVFVTSTQTSGGKIGGLAGADKICNDLTVGTAALAGKTFKAWLSVAGEGPVKRIAWKGGYTRTDKQLVASSRKDLLTATLLAPIDRDEKGRVIAPGLSARVWTNTNTLGEPAEANYDCAGFTQDIPDGGAPKSARNGLATATNGDWTFVQSSAVTCVEEARLYCFED